MVPSISSAWAMVLLAIMSARAMCRSRQTRRLKRGRKAAIRPVANTAHIAMTPHIENHVGDLNSRASTTSGGLVIHRAAT